MPVEISVSDARAALTRAASGAAGGGEPSTLLLGKLFHEVFADLVGRNAQRSGIRVILEAGPDPAIAERRLLDHAYTRLIAPRLLRHCAHLQQTTEAVLAFWRAQCALLKWLAEVTKVAIEREPQLRSDWRLLEAMLEPEVAVSCELTDPSWTDSVRLVGIADSLLRVPGRSEWCAIELKLGRGLPAVDLAQAALYHLILSRSGADAPRSALAVVRFSPEIEELLVTSDQVGDIQHKLLRLIGRLAGVLAVERPGRAASSPIPASTPPPAPASNTSPPPPRASARPPRISEAPMSVLARRFKPSPEQVEFGKRLLRAYRDYGITLDSAGAPLIGARFVRFPVRLGMGSRYEGLVRRSGEVQLRLGLIQEPIVSRENGRLLLDVVRPDPEAVGFSEVRDQLPPSGTLHGSAKVPVGVDAAGRLHFADLASPVNAHLLVAGTTGSGKTEWLRMAVAGLLETNTPETLRLVLIDPKFTAFPELERSEYLLDDQAFWVLGAERGASELLRDLVDETEHRYRQMREQGADTLHELVHKTGRSLPRIACVCDEYYALIGQNREEKRRIEESIFLLGAKARAAGVHLILATQQPSRKVIQGALDSNIPCRIGLLMAKAEESRMLLGVAGAERLAGNGDLLYKDLGPPQRLQAPYLDADERARVFGRRSLE